MVTRAESKPVGSAPMNDVTAGLQTKSDKIRALAKAGYSRAEIARYLDIRYQHVRNVLVDDERIASRTAPSLQPEARSREGDAATRGTARSDPTKSRIESNGRVAVPPAFLHALGLKENDPVILTMEEDSIRLMSLPASVRRAQAIVRQFVPAGVSLVDELLAERREEAKREDDNG